MSAPLEHEFEHHAYFASHPQALEPGAPRVEKKTTHISLVLLTADFVYKFKRPVRYAFIDQVDRVEDAGLLAHAAPARTGDQDRVSLVDQDVLGRFLGRFLGFLLLLFHEHVGVT